MDCSLLGSSVRGILQARILEWIAMQSRGSSWPRDWTQVSHVADRFFISRATREAQYLIYTFETVNSALNSTPSIGKACPMGGSCVILHHNPARKREEQREGKGSSASTPKSSRSPVKIVSTSSLALRNSRAESGLLWPWISLSRNSIPGFSGAGHTCHCHAFEQFEFLWCSMHRQPFCWCVLWKILFYPSFNSSRASSTRPSTVGCRLGVREKLGKTKTWLSPPFASAQCSQSHLKPLTASPGSRSLAGSLLGRSQWERHGSRAGWAVLSSVHSAQALARLSAAVKLC